MNEKELEEFKKIKEGIEELNHAIIIARKTEVEKKIFINK